MMTVLILRLSLGHYEFVKTQLNIVVVLLLYKDEKEGEIAYNAVFLKKIHIWIPSYVNKSIDSRITRDSTT
jgi:hypothetical protein